MRMRTVLTALWYCWMWALLSGLVYSTEVWPAPPYMMSSQAILTPWS